VLLFDHYPKAAGTTIRTWLLENFTDASVVFNIDDLAPGFTSGDFRSLPRHKRHRLKLVMGHDAGGLREEMQEGTVCVTVIREPIGRLLSFYHYAKQTPLMGNLHVDANYMDVTSYAVKHGLTHALGKYYGSVDQVQAKYEIVGDSADLPKFCKRVQDRISLPVGFTGERLNATPHPQAASSELQNLCKSDVDFYQELMGRVVNA